VRINLDAGLKIEFGFDAKERATEAVAATVLEFCYGF